MEDHTRTESFDADLGSVVKLPCSECRGMTKHEIIRSVVVNRDYDFMEHWEYFQIVKCRGCDDISLCHNWNSTEDLIPYDDGSEGLIDHIKVYPPRLAGRAPLAEAHLMPAKIHHIYSETHAALCSQQTVLAGIGMRAIVEAVCADKKAKGRGLQRKIDALVEQGLLTQDGATILHRIRTMGNLAAHEVQPHTETELRTGLDVVEHLLMGIYILKVKAEWV
jgi:hypothetical protein